MSLATDMHRDIASLISDLGQAVTLRRISAGTYTASSGTSTTGTTTNYTGRARIGDYADTLKDGTLIKQNDRKATLQLDDLTIIPAIGDTLVVGSDLYAVVNSMKTREVGGTAISYTLQIRR